MMVTPRDARAARSETQYRLLLEVSQKISGTIDLQQTLAYLLDSLRSVLDYDAAGIFVLNRRAPGEPRVKTHLIAGVASVGFDHAPDRSDPMLSSGKGIIGHVIATGHTVIAPDVSRDPYYVEGRARTRSELAVPIVVNGEVIGALDIESDRLHAYSDDDAGLLEAFAVAAAISIEKAVLHREVVEKHLIDHQMKIAGQVQASLLPGTPPAIDGYDIAALNVPAWEIGGDYFDFFPAEGTLGIVIADVSGKGVPAALLMATFRAALRSEIRKRRPIPSIIQDVHETLSDSMDMSRFVSAVYGTLDTGTGDLAYVNCGHNAPLLLHAGGDLELLHPSRPALGLFGGAPAEPAAARLEPGDTLLLYTDGVVELTDLQLADFGEERLRAVLSRTARLPAAEIIRALVGATREFSGRERYDDDFTLVVVKRQRPSQ